MVPTFTAIPPPPAKMKVPASSSANREEVIPYWIRPAFQTRKACINGYVRTNYVIFIFQKLKDIGLFERVNDTYFGHMVNFDWEGFKCNADIHAIIGQGINKAGGASHELWFRVGATDIRFSRFEYALVTGLRFGTSTFDPNMEHDIPDGGLFAREFARQFGRRVKVNNLRSLFERGRFDNSHDDTLKVAKILILYCGVLCIDCSKKYIDNWVWSMIDLADVWETFSWGKYSYQLLLHHYSSITQTIQATEEASLVYHLCGPIYALLVWIYEALPALGSGKCKYPNRLPRCTRWIFTKTLHDYKELFCNETVECFPRLEATPDERSMPFWHDVDVDITTGIQYLHRDGKFKKSRVDVKKTHSPSIKEKKRKQPINKGERDNLQSHPATKQDDPKMAMRSSKPLPPQTAPTTTKSTCSNNSTHHRAHIHVLPPTMATKGCKVGGTATERLMAMMRVELTSVLNEILPKMIEEQLIKFMPTLVEKIGQVHGNTYNANTPFPTDRPSAHSDVNPPPSPRNSTKSASVKHILLDEIDQVHDTNAPPPTHRPTTHWEVFPPPSPRNSPQSPFTVVCGTDFPSIPAMERIRTRTLPLEPPTIVPSWFRVPTQQTYFPPFTTPSTKLGPICSNVVHTPSPITSVPPQDILVHVSSDEDNILPPKDPKRKFLTLIDEDGIESSQSEYRHVRYKRPGPTVAEPFMPFDALRTMKTDDEYSAWLKTKNGLRNVGLRWLVDKQFFQELEGTYIKDTRKWLETDHISAYMSILHRDPGFAGVRIHENNVGKLQIVDVKFTQKCWDVWVCYHGKDGEVATTIDTNKIEQLSEDDLHLLAPYVVGQLPQWGQIKPWWELEEVVGVWRSNQNHWVAYKIKFAECKIIIWDSFMHYSGPAGSPELISESIFLRRMIPSILEHCGFYERRPELRKSTLWSLYMALPENVFDQTDSYNCGVFALKSIECMLSRRVNKIEVERNILNIRKDFARTIFKCSTGEETFEYDALNIYN